METRRDNHPFFATPKWRNWQTRQVQDLVSVKDVEVRVLSSAPFLSRLTANNALGPFLLANRFPPIFREKGIFWAFPQKETHMAGIRKMGEAYYCTFRFQGRR